MGHSTISGDDFLYTGGEVLGRYISIFLLAIMIGIVSFIFIIPSLIGPDSAGEVDMVIGLLLILIGSFIVTQLFYIIDLLQKNKS